MTAALAVQAPAVPAPMTFPQKLDYARELASSGMLPAAFRNHPESVLWALEYGEALGLRAVVAMASIHVIQGRPAPSAAMAAGLIRSRGHRLRIELTERTDEHRWGTAVATLIRDDDPDFTFRAEWSVEDAVAAQIIKLDGQGRITPNGSMGANWPKYPRQMMKARALGEVCRDGATDVLMGLIYLAEELDDAELDSNGNVVNTGPAPVSASITVNTPPENAHPIHAHTTPRIDDVDTVNGEGGNPEKINRVTQSEMMGLFRVAGIAGRGAEDRAKRLRVCEVLLDADLSGADGLNEEQGQVIVDALRLSQDLPTYVADLLSPAVADDLEGDDPADDPAGTDIDNPR